MRVRVVPMHEQRWLAWLLGIIGASALTWMVVNHSPHDGVLAFVGAAGALWMLGLLVSPRQKPFVATVRQTAYGVMIGSDIIEGVVEASVVPGKTGASVALISRARDAFVETSSMAEADQLVELLHAKVVDEFWVPRRNPVLRTLKLVAAGIGTFASLAMATVDYEKSIFGAVVLCGIITSLLHITESAVGSRVVVAKEKGLEAAVGTIKEHVILHSLRPEPVTEEPHLRIQVLERNEEPREKWLARIDALSAETYRGALPSKADLRAVFEDRQSPLEHRVAAARILVRRYDVEIAEIYETVGEDAPWFFEVASDDTEKVAESLHRVGPMFRA